MNRIHHSAETGYAHAADTYVAGRPDYPAGIVPWLEAALGLGTGGTAVEIGAGTGKFLPSLIATGARTIAVEPVAEMRDALAIRFPTVEARAGTAEAIPLGDASADAVLCAQAFHWFANAKALSEIVRVLKPGGCLGLVWNIRDERVPWVAELTTIMKPYEGDTPRHGSGAWKRVFPFPGLGPFTETRFEHGHDGPADRVVVDRILSVSFIAALPEDERAEVEAKVRGVIASHPELAGPSVRFPYVTVAYAARRDG